MIVRRKSPQPEYPSHYPIPQYAPQYPQYTPQYPQYAQYTTLPMNLEQLAQQMPQ